MHHPITRGIVASALALAALASVVASAAQTPPSPPTSPPPAPAAAPERPVRPPARPERTRPSAVPVTRPEDANGRPAVEPNSTLPPGVVPVPVTPPPATDAGGPEDQPPPIELDPPVCDFGFVKPSDMPTKKIKLKNTSDKPVTLLAIQPSCKCTTVNDLVGTEIPPHGFVELEASMKAQSSPGSKKAEIKVLVDGWSRVVNIQMTMEISLPVRVIPGYINAVRGQNQTGRIVVESLDKRPFRICSAGGRAPNLVGFDPAKDEPRNQYLLMYDVSIYKEGEMPRYLVLETDHPDCPLVDIFVRHEWTAPKPVLKLQDYRMTFGRIEEGNPGEFAVEIGELPANEELIAISTTMTGARVEFNGDAEHDGLKTKRKAKIYPPKDFTGLLYANVTVFTGLRQQEFGVWGMVVPKGHEGCLGLMEIGEGPSMIWKKPGGAAAAAPAQPATAPPPPAKTAQP